RAASIFISDWKGKKTIASITQDSQIEQGLQAGAVVKAELDEKLNVLSLVQKHPSPSSYTYDKCFHYNSAINNLSICTAVRLAVHPAYGRIIQELFNPSQINDIDKLFQYMTHNVAARNNPNIVQFKQALGKAL